MTKKAFQDRCTALPEVLLPVRKGREVAKEINVGSTVWRGFDSGRRRGGLSLKGVEGESEGEKRKRKMGALGRSVVRTVDWKAVRQGPGGRREGRRGGVVGNIESEPQLCFSGPISS